MNRIVHWAGLILAFGVFAAAVGYGSHSPDHVLRAADQALVKLSISHRGELRYECRRRTPEELEELPPNMRKVEDCPRERRPLHIRLHMDNRILIDQQVQPTGMAKDGTAYLYRRLPIPAGTHTFTLSVLDSGEPDTEPDRRTEEFDLAPGQVLVVEYVGGQFRLTIPGRADNA